MNVAALRESLLQKGVQLVAVSKYQPNEKLLFLYENGQRIFAENRVQEITSKYETLPKDIQWHLIGHLQRNKVKYIAPFVQMIHSVDSLALLEEIDKQAEKNNRVIDCLLQFHIAAEETKFGLDEAEARELLHSETVKDLQHIRICGVMGMGSFTEDTAQVKKEFAELHRIFLALKSDFFQQQPAFKEISMGMSGDYELAITQGSTMVRIGSLLFNFEITE